MLVYYLKNNGTVRIMFYAVHMSNNLYLEKYFAFKKDDLLLPLFNGL